VRVTAGSDRLLFRPKHDDARAEAA
jgi:hypothetical protein